MEIPFCRLYLISPPTIEIEDFSRALDEALQGGDVAAFQLRLKDADDDEIIAAAQALRPSLEAHDVALVINDRPDLAHAVGADGVHIGQQDGSVEAAREIVGRDCAIGVTCHDSRHLAVLAGEQGADYVAFGAFYPSTTKEPPTKADPEILTWWSKVAVLPCVAIGGITVDNCHPLIEAGADMIAVSSGVWNHPDGPRVAVTEFNKILSGE